MVESESLGEILTLFTSLKMLDEFLNFSDSNLLSDEIEIIFTSINSIFVNMASSVIGTAQH